MRSGHHHIFKAIMALLVLSGSVLGAQADRLSRPQVISRTPSRLPSTACGLWNNGDTVANYYSHIVAGERFAAYLNPQRCAASPNFPFEIKSVDISLFTFLGSVWPVEVAVEIWSAKGGDSCGGPGSLLYSEVKTLDMLTYGIPYIGRINLAQSVCVNGPFFVAVRYTGGTATPYPSVMFDSRVPGDTCVNWGYGPTTLWDRWNHFWTGFLPGNVIIWVDGETGSPVCVTNGCCTGMTGNVDCDPSGLTDISDLTRLIDYLYISFTPLCCVSEADVDGQAGIDISDLSRMIDYLYINFQPMAMCH